MFKQLACLMAPALLVACAQSFAGRIEATPIGTHYHGGVAHSHGSVATGEYRNLFAEAGYSDEQVTKKLAEAFQQLFYGDPKNQAVYFESGKNKQGLLAYIKDINSNDVRSEGMSYGMMIAVQMNKKKEFDALWNWAQTYMLQKDKSHPAYGFYAWSMSTDGKPLDEMPAPDGEEYFATALLFASGRWGDGKGIYNYRAESNQLLKTMLHREIITGRTTTRETTAGSLFHPDHRMVRFTPDLLHAHHTDASYHLPAFYELWGIYGPEEDRPFWKEAAIVSRDYFSKTAHPKTALTPDYGEFDGRPWAAPWRKEAVDFRYDAWRTAMNWSMDWAWWQADYRERDLSNRLQAFFESEGMDKYVSLYTLDGKKLNDGLSTGLLAMNAVASLAATEPRAQKFVKALWDHPVPEGQYRYYDGMLYLLAFLNCSGEYKAWLPKN